MDEIISLRINKDLKEKMKIYRNINWSEVLREALISYIKDIEKEKLKKRMKAVEDMERIRKSRVFDVGKNSTEIIREWRDKRK